MFTLFSYTREFHHAEFDVNSVNSVNSQQTCVLERIAVREQCVNEEKVR